MGDGGGEMEGGVIGCGEMGVGRWRLGNRGVG